MARLRSALVAAATLLAYGTAHAQLQITEVLYNSAQRGSNETAWEWIEVVNVGNSSLDLNGYVIADFGSDLIDKPNISNLTPNAQANNTVIPPGGVAVLYNGTGLDFEPSRFQNAWELLSEIQLIGVVGGQHLQLRNSGDSLAIWPSFAAYEADTVDISGSGPEVVTFGSAVTTVDYDRTNGFPPSGTGRSIQWSGQGDQSDGTQWAVSEEGVGATTVSIQTELPSTQINSSDDTASPGVVAAGTPRNGVQITEIFFNPRTSPEGDWEFVEIFNNTGSLIDFSLTPYILDDDDDAVRTEPNITVGQIPNGEVAVLIDDDLGVDRASTAWGESINFIPVDWTTLSNSGDSIGIWKDLDAYIDDRNADTFVEAVSAVSYDGTTPWPEAGGGANVGSIALAALGTDETDPANWILSAAGVNGAFNAMPVVELTIDHDGGDVGSPGIFGDGPPPPDTCGDFDRDDDVDTADRNTQVINWTGAVQNGGSASFEQGDCDADGDVDTADQNGLINNWTGAIAGKLHSAASDPGPFTDVGTNTDNTPFQIGPTDPFNMGAGPELDVGNMFPTEMDIDELSADLTLAKYASELGTGGRLDMRLAARIPEPSGLTLAMFWLLGVLRSRRVTR